MHRLSLVRALLLVAALASLPALSARAGDEPDPAAAFAARTALLPAPSEAKALRFEGLVRLDGKRMGYAVLEMRAAAGDPPTWVAVDHMVLKPQGVPMSNTATAHLSRSLAPLSGSIVNTRPGGGKITWERTEKGFHATKSAEGAEGVEKSFEHAGTVLHTLAAVVWFLREALPAKVSYRTSILEVEDGLKGEPALQPVDLEVLGEQDLQGKKVLVATGTKEGKQLTVLFHPESHDVLGVRLERGGKNFEIVAGDMWTLPAHDALTAGLRAALAFGTGDLEILDDVIDWPRFHAAILKAHPPAADAEPLTVPQLRQKLLQSWQSRLPKNPAGMIRGVLLGLKDTVKQQERDDGSVLLTFPASFKNMQLLVAERDGVWSLVAPPAVAK